MNAEDSLKLARRFIGLPLQKRQMFLAALHKEGVDFARFPIPHGVEAEDRQALSYAQQRMWFLWQLDPHSGAYNLPGAVRLTGRLNLLALEQAFASLVARHETLRTVFQRQADERLLQVPASAPLRIEHLDFSALSIAEREQAIADAAQRQSLLPFDLAVGPLLRVQLLKLAEHDHVLLLTLHHIVSDGWSMNVLIEEFIRCYDAHDAGLQPQLATLPIQYSDYALWQRRWLESGEQARQLEYWQATLGDEHPVLELPTDHSRPAMPSYRGTRYEFGIDGALAEQLRTTAQQHNITLFMLLLGAFNVLLHRYTGQTDLRVGVPIANRNRGEIEGLIGFFVNTQVLRTQLDGQTRVVDLLGAIKEAVLGAQAHQDLPFERLVEALKLERSLSHTPLFQVMYNHQPQVADISTVTTASGLALGAIEWEARTTQFDLTLDTYEKGGTLHAALTYANDLFDASTIERMAQHWTRLLQAIVADSNQRLGELPMLADSEQQVLVLDWNRTVETYPSDQCIHQLIHAQALRTPQASALVFGDRQLTYARLDSRANQLAHYLREHGVGPDVLVGIAAERSVEMVIGLLAILKAGGAYVPLDPEYPTERLAYMIEDSAIGLLLSQRAVLGSLPTDGVKVVVLDQDEHWLDAYSESCPRMATLPLNLAYVIYTSGSTGKPKGVGNSHAALLNRLCWMQQAYGLSDSDAVLQKTPFSFDVSVWEFFWPLMTGARLVVAPPGAHREPARLISLINEHRISTLHFVPSMLQAFIHEPGVEACASLKRIVCSGEALPLDAQQQVFNKLPAAGLYNLYGPTEAAIDVTHWTCVEEGADSVPIGRPIANLRTFVLDAQLLPVPVGVAGELYLGGAGLARSYHCRPGLTAERFVPCPFHVGTRLYRTGDRVRQRADGVIEYLGRLDHQVKLRGLRIEPGEIETRLMQHPLVREAVVLVQGGKHLVAYVVLEQEEAQWPQTLKAWLLSSLPEYMVPTCLMPLAAVPVTANGKLDRKALPLPEAAPQQTFVAPRDALQAALAQIWQDVLGVDRVGLEDNFFELGGDSIISIQVVSRARQAGIRLSPRDLFQYQTVRNLALVATVDNRSGLDLGPVSGEVFLTPAQHYFFEQAIAQPQHWNQSLLLTPRTALNPEALEAALVTVINHHDALRLCFSAEVNGWQQRHTAPVETSGLWQRHASSTEALSTLCDAAQRSLDLADGPLLRALLVSLDDGSQRLLLVIHHLAVDGVSWRVLLEDLQRAYAQLEGGGIVVLPGKTSAYQTWAARLQEHAHTLPAQLPYWQAQVGDARDLPCENPQGSLLHRHGHKIEMKLDVELTRQLLQDAPAAYRTQVNDLLLTALARVICRWTGHGSTLIQLEGHGREDLFDDVDLTRTVGWFTSLFPVRLQPQADAAESIKAIKEQLRAIPDKGLGYGMLRYLGEPAQREALAGLPAPRITFNYLGQFDRHFDQEALFVPAPESGGQTQDVEAPLANWLTLESQVYGGQLALQWGFSRDMFANSTVQQLADAYAEELKALIEHCCATPSGQATPSDFPLAHLTQAQLDGLPIAVGQIDNLYPLSPMQQGLLFHTLYEQAAGEYVNQLRVDVQGIDPERFRAAWQATVDTQDILRTGFVWQGELVRPLQIVHKQVRLPFSVLDWRERSDLAQALSERADGEREQGFDLRQAPLLRLVLVQTAENAWHLIYTHHHILMDGWSNSQLLAQVLQHYSGHTPPAVAGRYSDYIHWLQRQDAQASEGFWGEQLASLQEPTRLAQVVPGNATLSGHGDHLQAFDRRCTQNLEAFARQQKVTLNTLVQAAWLLLLQRYTGHETVAFGATVAGRPADLSGIEQQVGLFINTLPVIGTPRPDQAVGAWLQSVQAQNLGLREFEHTPLADIQRWAGHSGEALFDNILVFENYPIAQALQQGGEQGVVFGQVANLEQTHYPLSVAVTLGHTLSVHYSFDRGLFAQSAIERISAHLQHLLAQFVESAERCLGEIALTSAVELAQQRAANHPQPYPVKVPVHQRIAELAAQRPKSTAVIFAGQRFSYGAIDQRANQLAHALIARGVGPETRVGVALPRSEGVIVALLAILKAGGAYVPLDTSYPRERLAYLIEDSGLALLLTDSAVSAQLPVQASVSLLELDRLELGNQPVTAPQVKLDPRNLAYVIYTSGSTGHPKGVSVGHGPLAMHCQAIGERYEMRASDCEFHFMSFAFDGAHERWLTSLTHGASLLIRDDSLWTPEQTYNAMREHGVTVVAFPPVYLQQLAEHAERQGNPPKVRIYCFGGDAVPAASFERVKRALNPDYIINGYGPTETVVTPLIWKAGREVPCGAAYAPIGSRIGDRSAYVLDADLNLLPHGMAGELYLGGTGLARGYLNRPGLTAERFVADPFSVCGGLLYRTGDLVRQRIDGTFDYLDRIDNQVKIRGFRIELGEIEARLQALAGVREAVVVAQESGAGSGKRLVAYVVADVLNTGRTGFAETLREQLKESLPAHMVPAYLRVLERLPLTPNGKLDRKNLPKPDVSQLQQTYVAPQSVLEQQLASIWQDVLKLQQVGLSDNFFELGGDSIISIQVVSRARQLGIRFTPKDLFQHQTLQALARVARVGEQEQLIDQGTVTGKLALLPVQQVFFEQAIPERQHWNQAVMLTPTQTLATEILEQALGALVAHHDGLRLSFVEDTAGWHARYRAPDRATDALVWSVDVADAAAMEATANAAQRSLNLHDGPLLRAVLANLDDGSQRLLLVIHHLVVDGVSWRILFDDLQRAYRQLSAGEALHLPAKTSAAKVWAERLQTYARSAPLQLELADWQARLQDADATLPLDNRAGGLQNKHAVTVRTRLDRDLTRQLLQDAPAAYRTQVNDLLLTALARVIVSWSGADSALIQLEGHGREALFDEVDLTRTVGWFTSLYPARLTPTADLGGSLKQIKEQLRAIPDKGIGFGALAHLGDAAARTALGQLPVPRLTFNYLGQFDGSFAEAEGALFVPSGEAAGDELNAEAPLANQLALNGQVYGGELDLGWTFSREMFHEETIQRLADAYAQELQALIGHCCETGQHGITPSDFPLARLSQAQLDALPLPAQLIEDVYPLSPMQQGMLFHAVYEEVGGDYINQMRLDVEGLDPERFHQAWQAAVAGHSILRTRFVWQGDLQNPVQVVSKHAPMPYSLHDLSAHPQPEQAMQALADRERQTLSLSDASLLRLVIVRLDEQRYHLIYTNHHILMDGWSNSQLLGEVLQRYSGQFVAASRGRYRDYIDWLQRQDAAAGEAFWTPTLRELEEPTRLAQTVTQPPTDAEGYGDFFQVLDAELTARLGEFARASKVTVNTLVQAAWLLLLQRYSGKDTVAFGATVAGRPADLPGVEQQIGLFINTLPVIATPRAEQSLDSWLQAVQAHNVALREFEHTPLFDIQRWAGQGGEALFDTLMVFENYPISQALEQGAPQGLRFGPVTSREQTNYPLTLLVSLERELTVHFSYRHNHFAPATVVQLATQLQHLLSQMVVTGHRCLAELVLLGQAEHQRIIHDWNRSDEGFADNLCIHQLIARQVAASPDALAVTFGTKHLSYAKLDAQANRLAHKLIEVGVGPEVRVGVAMQRSDQLLVALLAVLKAGGAYVPLDPQYPAERVAYMLEDSGALLLLTEQAVVAQLNVACETQVLLMDAAQDRAAYPDHAPQTRVTPGNLAYLIYTSGSTGKPKGVAIAHRNVGALIDWSQSVYSRDDIQGVLASTSVCFDLSVWELFVTLANGGSLIIARNALELPQLPARDHVRLINTVPSAINALHGAGQIPPSVRIINLAGEPLKQSLVEALYAQPTVEHVFDLYGPSEDTTYSTWTRRTAGGAANIGRPLKHTASYLLDADLQPVPQGVSAELYLAGAGITRGYLGRPGLTAERYVPNPFAGNGEPLYRTGDLARYQAGGVLEYRGRIDHQVKIRGLRIELSEIEARLLQVPMVSEVAVLAQEALDARQLVAYVVAPQLALDDAQAQRRLRDQLKARLKESLPEYMVPAHFLFIAQLPLTPNGKLDRKALPAVDASQMQASYIAPRSEIEQQVAAIWEQVLMIERVGLNDHFFELGGHSLLAVNVVSRIALELGLTLTPQLLFQNPVLSDFVARLEVRDGAINEQKLSKLESLLDEMEEV